MLSTPSIRQVRTTRPDLHAFRISGTVTREDMARMAEHMNTAFDSGKKQDMLLIFDGYEGSEVGASLSIETMRAQVRALWSVGRYAVANAPKDAADMIEAMDAVIPVKAEAFDSERAAFQALDASPVIAA